MCGLFGCKTVARKNYVFTDEQRISKAKIIEGLAIAMQDRGKDSTGIATITGNHSVMYKDTITAKNFVNEKRFSEVLLENPEMVIGHTRFATTGAVTPKNAHPFKRGKIIGAHNGVVRNFWEFKSKAELEVDSEAIFYLLNKTKNNYSKSFKKLSGVFALTWVNLREKNTMYIARDGNPLFGVFSENLNTLFWCSHQFPLFALVKAIGGGNVREVTFDEELAYKIDGDVEMTTKEISFKSAYTTGYSTSSHISVAHHANCVCSRCKSEKARKSAVKTTQPVTIRATKTGTNAIGPNDFDDFENQNNYVCRYSEDVRFRGHNSIKKDSYKKEEETTIHGFRVKDDDDDFEDYSMEFDAEFYGIEKMDCCEEDRFDFATHAESEGCSGCGCSIVSDYCFVSVTKNYYNYWCEDCIKELVDNGLDASFVKKLYLIPPEYCGTRLPIVHAS